MKPSPSSSRGSAGRARTTTSRHDRPEDFRFQLDKAVRWDEAGSSGLRIAVAGTSGANQYGFYGDDVDNYVQYVVRHFPEADFQAIERCAARWWTMATTTT